MTLRIVFKYGLAGGLLIILFAFLKSEWFFSGLYPDLFLTLMASFFAGAGIWLRHFIVSLQPAPEIHTNTEDKLKLLSRREQEVLELLYSKRSNKEIADILHIELSTLKTHINSIYRKLGVKTRKQLPDPRELSLIFN